MDKDMWEGQVPVVVNLAPNEITRMQSPSPLYLLLPRMGYLPLATEAVRAHFLDWAPAREDEMWFDHLGVPLKWGIPIGVLFDLLLPTEGELPLPLTVHFQRFPNKRLVRCQSAHTVRSHYMHTLKEACCIKYGTAKPALVLPQSAANALWDSIVQVKHGAFAKSVQAVRELGEQQKRALERLPVRLLVSGYGEKQDFKPIVRVINALTSSGQEQTLLSLLTEELPGLVFSEAGKPLPGVRLRVQGVQPPLDTPLKYLCEQLCHPDQFLYVAVHKQAAFK